MLFKYTNIIFTQFSLHVNAVKNQQILRYAMDPRIRDSKQLLRTLRMVCHLVCEDENYKTA